jgi:hypothetical protein
MKKYEVYTENFKGEPLNHDYDISIQDENGVTLLLRSHSDQWSKSARGEWVGSLDDDGNGVTIHLRDKKKPIVLDYQEAMQLQLLLVSSLEKEFVTEIKQVKETETVLKYTGLS